jgi:cobyrinic acid a,c-diamide synthase
MLATPTEDALKRIVIAGVQSGAGKTTIATGLMAALAARGTVQAFKAGPDYIDPSYHARATGRPSRNLDTWMVEPQRVLELFQRAAGAADYAVVEGVMGLYDGRTGEGDAGSTASIAKLLRAPVVLVVDAAKIARSAAAIVLGFRMFDPAVNVVGVILNRVASPRHYEAIAGPIEREAGVPVIGSVPRDPDLTLPERYLGLIPTTEGAVADAFFENARRVCAQSIDLDRLDRIAACAPPLTAADRSDLFPSTRADERVRIAVARDRAFSFYYEDNLDLLRAWGAEIVEFSPLFDAALPPDVAGVYLGGGFPELFAAELAANAPLRAALAEAAREGMPIYAECGGLMYLGEALSDEGGAEHAMTGIVPVRSRMRGGRLSLGYRELRTLRDTPIAGAGATLRAHEFHWSALEAQPPADTAAYRVAGASEQDEGYASGSVLASYMHLHFASDPQLAPRFVAACRAHRAQR